MLSLFATRFRLRIEFSSLRKYCVIGDNMRTEMRRKNRENEMCVTCQSFDLISIIPPRFGTSDVDSPHGVIDFNLSNHVCTREKFLPLLLWNTLERKVYAVGRGSVMFPLII